MDLLVAGRPPQVRHVLDSLSPPAQGSRYVPGLRHKRRPTTEKGSPAKRPGRFQHLLEFARNLFRNRPAPPLHLTQVGLTAVHRSPQHTLSQPQLQPVPPNGKTNPHQIRQHLLPRVLLSTNYLLPPPKISTFPVLLLIFGGSGTRHAEPLHTNQQATKTARPRACSMQFICPYRSKS